MATAGVPLWSTTASSNSTADPAVNWAEGMAPSGINDSARAMMASVAKWRNDLYGITTGGSSTAFTVATGSTFASASDMSGAVFTIIPHTTSGASPTLAVDGLTARAINQSTGVAIATGALISGNPYLVKYVHASTEFILLGFASTYGSLTLTGTLGVAGNFAVNTNKFTVAASSGDTVVAGTLGVTGAATLSSTLGVTGAATLSSTLGVTGAATLSSTLGVTGAATLSSTLAVTGASTLTGALSANNSAGITGRNTVKAFGKVVNTALASGSFNVSGVADNGATHTVSFTSAMANTNYIVILTLDSSNANESITLAYENLTTGGFDVNGYIAGLSVVDPDSYSFMVLSNE